MKSLILFSMAFTAMANSSKAPKIKYIGFKKSEVRAGEDVVLSYYTKNAKSVEIQGIGKLSNVNGKITVTPQQSRDYKFIVKNSFGITYHNAKIRVTNKKWTWCSKEHGTCKFSKKANYEILYGTNWNPPNIIKTFNNVSQVKCNNKTLGGDPRPGKVKTCYWRFATGSGTQNPEDPQPPTDPDNPEVAEDNPQVPNIRTKFPKEELPNPPKFPSKDPVEKPKIGNSNIFPNTNDGLPIMQLGTNFMDYWALEEPYLNEFAVNKMFKDFKTGIHFNPVTQSVISIPNTGSKKNILGIIREGASYNVEFYNGTWVLEWSGSGVLEFAGRGSWKQNKISDRRIEMTTDSNDNGRSWVTVKSVSGQGIKDIKVYRKKYENLVKAGKIFSPDFIKTVKKYKVLRNMDWNEVNDSKVTNVEQLSKVNDMFFGNDGDHDEVEKGIRVSVPLEHQALLAKESDTAWWLCIPPMLGAPESITTEGFRDPGNYSKQVRDRRVNAIKSHLSKILASNQFNLFAKKVIAALDKYDYPENKMIYLELGNEIWNFAYGFNYHTEYFLALENALKDLGKRFDGGGMRGSYGYLSAKLLDAFEAEFAKSNRKNQAWKIVIGTQTSWPGQSRGSLLGVEQYYKDKNQNALISQKMSKIGIATTGYYSGGFYYSANSAALFGNPNMGKSEWIAKWKSEFRNNKSRLGQLIYDFLSNTNENAPGFSIGWVVGKTKEHEQVAKDFGASFIGQYEGLSHDVLDPDLRNDEQIKKFYNEWIRGEQSGNLVSDAVKLYSEKFPGKLVANFHLHGAVTERNYKPFQKAFPWETNKVTEALDEFLRE